VYDVGEDAKIGILYLKKLQWIGQIGTRFLAAISRKVVSPAGNKIRRRAYELPIDFVFY